MTSKNISIKKEAYDFLKGLKSDEMSFSDVILSFKKDRGNILRFWGKLKHTTIDEEAMKSFREDFNKRMSHDRS
ncbi:MAG: antitoxin VapB family protein [Candidatus Woesearchaeota archaeon]